MKSTIGMAALLIAATIPNLAQSAPWIFYDPTSGGVWLKNDTGANFTNFSVISAGNHLKTDANLFASVPGAILDSADLPSVFTYLDFPPTNSFLGLFVGNVVTPGTPPADLSGHYRIDPIGPGVSIPGPVELIPEPASGLLSAIGVLIFTATVRRSRCRCQSGSLCPSSNISQSS